MQRVLYLETWRWALFFAGFAPIFYLSQLLVHGLILGVEAKLFTTRQAMYYAVSIQVLAHSSDMPLLLSIVSALHNSSLSVLSCT